MLYAKRTKAALVSLSLVFIPATHGLTAEDDIKTVVATGYGENVSTAAQNAAKNALNEVVGSFIDAEQRLEKQTKIQEGIREQTSEISTDIKEYSQGSIERFDVVNVGTKNGLTEVTANVAVQIEDFRHYIQELAQGEADVEGASLFAQASSAGEQKENKAALLSENVLLPVMQGTVAEFDIQTPYPFSQLVETMEGQDVYDSAQTYQLEKWAQGLGSENVFVFDVTLQLKPEFASNMQQVLSNIAEPETVRHTPLRYSFALLEVGTSQGPGDLMVVFNDGTFESDNPKRETLTSQAHLVESVKGEIEESFPEVATLFTNREYQPPNLTVSLLNADDETLQSEVVTPEQLDQGSRIDGSTHVIPADLTHEFVGTGGNFQYDLDTVPWTMLSPPGTSNSRPTITVLGQRKFHVLMQVDPSALAETQKVQINLQ